MRACATAGAVSAAPARARPRSSRRSPPFRGDIIRERGLKTMPVRPIVRLGHPALRSVAQALHPGRIGDPAVQELVDDMIETMRAAHGVGLAAPQVGTSLQIFVYEMAPPAVPAPEVPASDVPATDAPAAPDAPDAPNAAPRRAPEPHHPGTPAHEAH